MILLCVGFLDFVMFFAFKHFITFWSHQESNLGPQDCEPNAVSTRLRTYSQQMATDGAFTDFPLWAICPN